MRITMQRTFSHRSRSIEIDALATRINSLKDQLQEGDPTPLEREFLDERIAHWRRRLAFLFSGHPHRGQRDDSKE